MTIRTILRGRVLLAVLALSAAVAITTAAGAAPGPKAQRLKAERDTPAVMKDIREGKARKLHTASGRAKRTTGVWNGCHFVYLTTDISDYEFDDGSVATISENPEPLPPKEPGCVERNPTEPEMTAMHAVVNARNAGGRPPGDDTRPLPPTPRASHLGTP
jgi:hypothetical protein